MEKYIVTVESGGTKTRICLFDSADKCINQFECRGVGAVGDADIGEFADTLRKFDSKGVTDVIVNLGGTNTEQIKNIIKDIFPLASVEVYRESSGVIMNAVCDMKKADVLLMAGTGVICLARGEKGFVIADGWGADIGDCGSGYWIGMEAIKRSLLKLEEGKELSPLVRYITGQSAPLSATDNTEELMRLRDEIRANFLPLDREKTASFAKISAQFAHKGDETAKEIFRDAGVCLAQTVARAMQLTCCKSLSSLLVSGGLASVYDLWGESFEKTLGKRCAVRVEETDMTAGMLQYIKNKKRGF